MHHVSNCHELLFTLADFFPGNFALAVSHQPVLFYPETFSLSESGILTYHLSTDSTLFYFYQQAEHHHAMASLPTVVIQLSRFITRLLEQHHTLQKGWTFEHQHDSLTRLPNRHSFHEALFQAWTQFCHDHTQSYGVILLNIDRFKRINDSMGYLAGDCLLFQVSARLNDLYQDHRNLVARVGGDEFAFLFFDRDIEQKIKTLQHTLSLPFNVFGQNVFLSFSSGSSISNTEHTDEDMIHQEAERALKVSKQEGRGRHTCFDTKHMASQSDRIVLEEDLRKALESFDQITLYIQDIVCAQSKEIYGHEVLARWQHPTRGLLLPSVFMPIIEENHLELPFDRHIIHCVFQKMYTHTPTQHPNVHINLSPKHIHDTSFLPWLDNLHTQYPNINPATIYFEITEGTLIDHPIKAEYMMTNLHQRGFKLVLDDFGTGYSSLSYLAHYQFDELKIDRGFIKLMHTHKKQRDLVSGLIALSHELGMKVVAEGVEDELQSQQLTKLSCDYLQGHHYSEAHLW